MGGVPLSTSQRFRGLRPIALRLYGVFFVLAVGVDEALPTIRSPVAATAAIVLEGLIASAGLVAAATVRKVVVLSFPTEILLSTPRTVPPRTVDFSAASVGVGLRLAIFSSPALVVG